jgi:hypothetical protein
MAEQVSFGSFGSTPDDVSGTDFYGWFHFGQLTKTLAEEGVTTVTHRTTGGFRDLVVLTVAADADGQTDSLSLRVARSFIDDPRDGVFALDVVASFIREGAVGQGFEAGFALLLGDLRSHMHRYSHVVYTDSNPLPPLPRLPGDFGPAFAVYSGADAAFSTQLAHTDLRLSNDRFDGVGALTVSYHRQAANSSQPPRKTPAAMRDRVRACLPD